MVAIRDLARNTSVIEGGIVDDGLEVNPALLEKVNLCI